MTKKLAEHDQEQLDAGPRRTPDSVLGPPPRRSLLYNRSIDKLLLILPLIWFMYYSWRPISQLKTEMPPQFVDVPSGVTLAGRAREQRIAQGYWDVARAMVRAGYEYGSALPDSPPLDFRLSQALAGSPAPAGSTGAKKAPARTRAAAKGAPNRDTDIRYWRKLQEVWFQPYAWNSTREFSTAWLAAPVTRFCENFQQYLKNRFRAI